MRATFEAELKYLKDELLLLGNLVEQQIQGAVESFKQRDPQLSRTIVEKDDEVNEKRYMIEEQVLITIATQQPMARDLRLLASILEIAGELERIGDYAKGIATINIRMGEEALLTPLVKIPMMAEKCSSMLHRAIQAFIQEDIEEANQIPREDDEVDRLYEEVYSSMMEKIVHDENAIQRANWILWVAHNLERVADRVTNICERTIFTVTGDMKEIRSSDQ
ncbi:MAG TPA: phosphate signaling complex protein PhoU [Anaerolineaceae bacterium]|jgi:phosphate transport system protein|nr:phosphate signaling complex protein PhoU [Anaerolineaceae bacterium]HNR00904.1 phosphate signaling complex protein PhoU [Anaerolineaceae bacterium]HNS06580.1 phosphate signaling complex protein PhoU [Anaerolineaceae bacterium]HNW13409.1 phosphate signaling complex protein PhoU [Anaerolineaceae bacterium]HPD62458.1 phosphate signaling complex protein PhoU [Anaerolineaceae bacterium]